MTMTISTNLPHAHIGSVALTIGQIGFIVGALGENDAEIIVADCDQFGMYASSIDPKALKAKLATADAELAAAVGEIIDFAIRHGKKLTALENADRPTVGPHIMLDAFDADELNWSNGHARNTFAEMGIALGNDGFEMPVEEFAALLDAKAPSLDEFDCGALFHVIRVARRNGDASTMITVF